MKIVEERLCLPDSECRNKHGAASDRRLGDDVGKSLLGIDLFMPVPTEIYIREY